jgi:hypothetical protein
MTDFLFIVAMYSYEYVHQQMFSPLSCFWLLFLAGGLKARRQYGSNDVSKLIEYTCS